MASALGIGNRMDRGERVADIRDFGARPRGGPGAALTNRVAIQAAHDWLVATAIDSAQGGDVYVPAGDWYIDRPLIFDGAKIGIRGEGASRTRILGGGTSHDLLVLGVLRVPNGVALTSDHFVDLYNGGPGGSRLSDSSAVTGANQKWGLRLKGDTHLAQQGGVFDTENGNYYKTTRQVTFDFAIDFSNVAGTGGWPTSGALFGQTEVGNPSPISVMIVSSKINVTFRTIDPTGGIDAGVNRSFTFWPVPGTLTLARFTFQIDLVNATVAAWVDGVQVATSNTLGAGFTSGANLSFVQNQHCPFGIGSNGPKANKVFDYYGSSVDITFCGLKVSGALIYSDLGVGVTQARVDAAAITDSNRYFTKVTGTTGLLPLTDNPAVATRDRVVTAYGRHYTSMYFLDNTQHGSDNAFISCGEIRDLYFKNGDLLVGTAIVSGYSLHLNIHNCTLNGGSRGFGCLNFGANYELDIQDCKLGGADTCLYLYFTSSARIRRVFLDRNFRAGIRLVENVEAQFSDVFTPSFGTPDYIIKAVKAQFTISNMVVDNEDPFQGAQIACIYASPGYSLPIAAYLDIARVYAGSSGPTTPFLYLDDGTPEDGVLQTHAMVEVKQVLVPEQQRGPLVVTNGPRWRGTVSPDSDFPRHTAIKNLGTSSNVVTVDRYHTGPPRDSTYAAGCHHLRVAKPVLGQFAEWRCVVSGSYGTASPPSWIGINPLDDGLSLGAYIPGGGYWSATGSPAGSQGAWSNGTSAQAINAIFGGTVPTSPAQVYAGLLTRWSTRSRYYLEMPSVNGYARVAVPPGAWSASSGGVISNANAIAFPTATGNWDYYGQGQPASVLGLFSASTGGSIYGQVDIAPVMIGTGLAFAIDAGAIVMRQLPTSPQGGFATRLWDAIHNHWIKNTAITVPTLYLALSTGMADPTTGPTEPSGGGYARVAMAGKWALAPNASYTANGATGTTAVVSNSVAATFPAPSGDWGLCRSVYLMDAASGGNVWAAGNLTVARSIAIGSAARSFAIGALWACI